MESIWQNYNGVNANLIRLERELEDIKRAIGAAARERSNIVFELYLDDPSRWGECVHCGLKFPKEELRE